MDLTPAVFLVLDVASHDRHVLPCHRGAEKVLVVAVAHAFLKRVLLLHPMLANRFEDEIPVLLGVILRVQEIPVFRVDFQPGVVIAVGLGHIADDRARHRNAVVENLEPLMRRWKSAVIDVTPERRGASR